MQVRCLTTGRVRGKRRTGAAPLSARRLERRDAAGARLRRRSSGWDLPLRHRPDGEGVARRLSPAVAPVPPTGALRARAGGRGRIAARPAHGAVGRDLAPAHRSRRGPLGVRACGRSRLPSRMGARGGACLAACAVTSPSTGRPGSLRGSWTSRDRPLGPSPPLTTWPGTAACSWCRFPGTRRGTPALLVDGETLLAGDASWPGDELRVLGAHDPGLRPG